MNKEEFRTRMEKIRSSPGPEERHIKADRLLCEALKELGYKRGIDIFRKMTKWYS